MLHYVDLKHRGATLPMPSTTVSRKLEWIAIVGSHHGARPPRESEIDSELPRLLPNLPQLKLKAAPAPRRGDRTVDGLVTATLNGVKQSYAYEYRAQSAPRVVEMASAHVARAAARINLRPLVLAPHLSEERLSELVGQGVSGLDLCGNAALLGDGFIYWRSGQPNRYRESRPLQNVFRGDSSAFARSFLLRGHFDSLAELQQFARDRLACDGEAPAEDRRKLTLATASKVVQALEQERIVQRTGRELELADGQALMNRLLASYRPPSGARLAGKMPLCNEDAWRRLRQARNCGEISFAATGLGSAGHYGALAGGDTLALYVSDLEAAAEMLEARKTRVFPNVELIEAGGIIPYFDCRPAEDGIWASPVQTWLELSAGGAREREAAAALERALSAGRGETLR